MPPLDRADPSRSSRVELRLLDHRVSEIARTLHSIEQAAYVHEAALIGAVDFPPLRRAFTHLDFDIALVSTARGNVPALALYERFGFQVAETRHVGIERLPLVHLRYEHVDQATCNPRWVSNGSKSRSS